MKNAESIIKGIDLTIEGLSLIKSALTNASGDTTAAPKTTAPATAPAAEGATSYTTAELNAMPYNKFKTLAAKLGVKCTGTRDDIMGRIAALGVISDSDDPAETPAPTETSASETKKRGKLGKKTEPDPEPEEPAETTSSKSDKPVGGKRGLVKKTAEPAGDEFDEQAKAIAGDTPVEDIIFALAEVNVKATKKNYLEKLAYALREGLLEPEDEGEAEAEANTAVEPEDDEDETHYTTAYDPEGYNDPASMSDERREAVSTLVDEILTDYSEGKLTAEDMTKFLEENCTEEECALLEDSEDEDELVNFYIEMKKRFIDNDGDAHENEDPYELGESDFCCGHPLKHNRKSGKYICEMCGNEYEAE